MYVNTSMVAQPMVTLRLTWPFIRNLALEALLTLGKGISADDIEYQTRAVYTITNQPYGMAF